CGPAKPRRCGHARTLPGSFGLRPGYARQIRRQRALARCRAPRICKAEHNRVAGPAASGEGLRGSLNYSFDPARMGRELVILGEEQWKNLENTNVQFVESTRTFRR